MGSSPTWATECWAVFPTAVCKTVVHERSGAADEGFNSFTAHCNGGVVQRTERRALNPDGDGSNPSPAACALMVKRTSWLPPKEQVQVRFLVGVLTDIPGVWRKHAALRRRRFMQVRLLPGILTIALLAQSAEQLPLKQRVAGSIPAEGTVAEPKAVAGSGCEPDMCGFDSHRPP